MNLLDDWKLILKRAWSIRMIILSVALSAAEVIIPLFSDMLPRNTFTVLAVLAAVGGAAARVIQQPSMAQKETP